MLIDDAIALLLHTKEKLGGKTELIFQFGYGAEAKQFDFGEKGRTNYGCCISPYDTQMHIDGYGRYVVSIRRIPFKVSPNTPEVNARFMKSLGLQNSDPEYQKQVISQSQEREKRLNNDPELQEYFETS